MESKQPVQPVVGMGATVLMYSDRYAATIVEVKSPSRIVIQADRAIRADKNGMCDSQSYNYEPNPQGRTWTVTRRRDGTWKVEYAGTPVRLDCRDEYFDYGF